MSARLAALVAALVICACPAPLGAPCNRDLECPEGHCEDGRCVPGPDPDDPPAEGEGEPSEGEGEPAEGEGEGEGEGEPGEGEGEGDPGEGEGEGEGEGDPDGTCALPFALQSGANTGDTTGAASVIPGSETSCSGDGDAPEQVWRFDAPTPGLLALALSPNAWSSILYVRDRCATAASELDCDGLSGGQTENQLTVQLAAAGPVDVVVDGDDTAEVGGYTLDAAFTSVVCGDGAVSGWEDCDGSEVPGNCTNHGFVGGSLACDDCAFDTGGCLTQICGNGAIEGTEVCDGSNFGGLSCANVVMDGSLTCNSCTSITTGACTSTCGSGFLTAYEACDDGNTANGDGCSSTCAVSGPAVEQEAPGTGTPDNDDGAPNTKNAGDGDLATNDFALGRVNGPISSTVLIQGAINVPGDEDAFQITNPSATAEASVRVQTQGATGLTSCPGPTVITVRDFDGALLGSFQGIYDIECTRVDISGIPAGATFFVIVSDLGDDSSFGPYYLQVEFL
ncbi:MAG: hypothetical protein IT383_13730 [Deltaproteobacteria bacterium]|nr:hypothetical protein [Deltaproteobacteria bacterium]